VKAGEVIPVALATVVAVAAVFEVVAPFNATLHAWWFALAASVAGVYLLFVALLGVAGRTGYPRPVALAAFGGALLAAGIAFAAFLMGEPHRLPGAPGQTYRLPHGGGVAIEYPDVPSSPERAAGWPDYVTIDRAPAPSRAQAGDTVRTGGFVFAVSSGPIAHVEARTPAGSVVTVTQPDGPAFLSPFLTFGGVDGTQPEDYFAVPALHRTVQADYWAGLPSRGIDVPFLELRIAEENGGALYEGVAVTGRPLRKAGVVLTFTLGTYPVVTAASAPPLLPLLAGLTMVAAGLTAFVARAARKPA
jgi:hypothetical protein